MVKKYSLDNKKFLIFVSLMFLVVFIVVSGASYAFFTTSVKGKEFAIYTGNLKVDYSKKTDTISIDNLYPMTDTEGLKQMSHEFTVTNKGNIDARYQVRLELDDTKSDMVDIRYIKMSYQVNGGDYSEPVLLSDLNSSLVFTKNIIVKPNESNTYGIKLWIDLSASNDIQGKEFKARVVVDSIQNVDDSYQVDTIPIIYLNKDSNGNQDIHLKVGETYQELGVEKVEDDQDIFTSKDVVISYEYYDGTSINTVANIDTSKVGIYYVNYSVTDRSNQVGKKTRVVTVNNSSSVPKITLNGDSNISLGESDYYQESGVTVEDNNQVITIGEVKTSSVGSYTVRYIVIDSNGNLNSVVRTVVVNSRYKESILNGTDPVLASNLVPVVISDSGVVTKASTAFSWYNYENKVWANSVILKDESVVYKNGETIPESNIESYFVWIPKYSYQIWDLGNYSSLTTISNKTQEIKIKFGTNNTSDSVSGECTTPFENNQGIAGSSGNCKVGDYMTHPAFLAFDTLGLWVGKFETGYDGATTTETAQVNNVDTSKIVIKPNVYSWRNMTVGNMFKNSYDYQRNLDSHMMKNTEWGSVAYLQHSAYGSGTNVRINNNSSNVTGFAGTEKPTLGYNSISINGNRYESTNLGTDGTYTINYLNQNSQMASTTNNYNGIYDISGGAWEYVMGYTTTTVSDESTITNLYPNFFSDSSYSKYWDKYTSTAYTNYNNRILGDATGEMGPFGSEKNPDGGIRYKSSWYKPQSYFANSSRPWFGRGGAWHNGADSGAFAFTQNTGVMVTGVSYRIVLAP